MHRNIFGQKYLGHSFWPWHYNIFVDMLFRYIFWLFTLWTLQISNALILRSVKYSEQVNGSLLWLGPKKLLQVCSSRQDRDITEIRQTQDRDPIFGLKGKQHTIYLFLVFDKSQNLGPWNLQGLQGKMSKNISGKHIYKKKHWLELCFYWKSFPLSIQPYLTLRKGFRVKLTFVQSTSCHEG